MQWSNSPRRSPQFPTRWQKFPFVQRYNAHSCLHNRNELFKLHLLVLLLTASHAESSADCCYIHMAHLLKNYCLAPSAYSGVPRFFLLHQNIAPTVTAFHNIILQCSPLPWLLLLLSTKDDSNRCPFCLQKEEDKKKKDISARQWAGCEMDDGTSLLHNSGAPLNIIVMKAQSLPPPIPPLLG